MASENSTPNTSNTSNIPLNAWWAAENFDAGTKLLDKVNATITKAKAYVSKLVSKETGKITWLTQVELEWTPDEGTGEPALQSYMVGWVNGSLPSKDGSTPAGMSYDEYVALGKGDLNDTITPEKLAELSGPYLVGAPNKRLSMMQTCSMRQLADALTELKFDNWGDGSLENLIGYRFYCHRVPQAGSKKEEDKKEGEKEGKGFTVLIPIQALGKVSGVGSSSNSSSSSSSSSNSSSSTINSGMPTDPEEFAESAIMLQLNKVKEENNDEPKPLGKTLMQKRVNGMNSDPSQRKMKNAVFEFINNDVWLSDDNRPWIYDGNKKELNLP